MISSYLKNNNLIICPNSFKKKIINEINNLDKLVSYKVISLNEFNKKYFFDYSKQTIYYLMTKLNIKYEIALEYLESLYYISDKKYNSNKLNNLLNIKKELINNNLLIFDELFKETLTNKNIIVIGPIDNFYKVILNNYNTTYIPLEYEKRQVNLNHFNTIEEEVSYFYHDVISKVREGISINNINLITPTSEYINVINRLSSITNILVDLKEKTSLYDLNISKKVLELIEENKSFEEIINNLNYDKDLINLVINIFNNYTDFSETGSLYELIKYDLKHTYITDSKRTNSIKTISIENIDNTKITYLLGFNKENYPTIYKDEDFLNDQEKQELGLFTSNDNNINEIANLRFNIYNNNLIISSKDKDSFNTFNECILTSEDNFNIIENNKIDYSISNLYNEISMSKMYDNFYKFGVVDDNLKSLSNNYPNSLYHTYDNSFNGIDKTKYLNYLNNKLTLSYTTIDNFYKCGFRYYLSNVLKIEDNSDDFMRNIGNIFHYVLSKCFENNFDFEKEWNTEASKYDFKLNQVILLDKLKEELKYDIEIINKHKNYTYFDKYMYENRFDVYLDNDKGINVKFTGVADKISYLEENNRTLVAVTDYKTGNPTINLSNIIYGLGMQLPIYSYFINRSNLFNNPKIVGFYLQKVINKDMKEKSGSTFEELKEEALKLDGYSTSDVDALSKFDMTYNSSAMIKSLKTKTDGNFYSYSKVLTEEEMLSLDNLVDTKINEAKDKILNAEFDINPKRIDKDLVGCEYCKFRDICYRKEEDIINLNKNTKLDFLGGDDNA